MKPTKMLLLASGIFLAACQDLGVRRPPDVQNMAIARVVIQTKIDELSEDRPLQKIETSSSGEESSIAPQEMGVFLKWIHDLAYFWNKHSDIQVLEMTPELAQNTVYRQLPEYRRTGELLLPPSRGPKIEDPVYASFLCKSLNVDALVGVNIRFFRRPLVEDSVSVFSKDRVLVHTYLMECQVLVVRKDGRSWTGVFRSEPSQRSVLPALTELRLDDPYAPYIHETLRNALEAWQNYLD